MTWQVGVVVGVAGAWAVLGAAAAVRAAVRRSHRRRDLRRRTLEGDPLETLVLQMRLGEVARELQALGASRGFAVAHHTRAAQAAYDALLAEACRRAGLPVSTPLHADEQVTASERLREELELASRGWSW
jgi:hypothetical protein